ETTTGALTEAQAVTLLRRATTRRRCTIEASRTGRVIVQRKVWDGGTVPKVCTIVLDPVVRVAAITPTARGDLDAIAAHGAYLVTGADKVFRELNGRIAAGLVSIAPAASQRLIDRGLVVLGAPYRSTSNGYLPEMRTPVRVSLAARLVMLADDHRTHTTTPGGYGRPADSRVTAGLNKPGGRAGVTYDGTSGGSCSCGGWSGWYDGQDGARRAARAHRQEAAAAFVLALP
ncbi:hypothetical protein ABZ454_38930, partial [Streptomyces sp. NPDC005803]|uniref:hypothetical protein n=1 Tax=Streptomyces sp. NPDC005803 TaxID=3154297 RepID=UPI00340C16D3